MGLHPHVRFLSFPMLPFISTTSHKHTPQPQMSPHQFLEEVPDPLVVAPLLHAGQESVVELLVDLVQLRHFEEDGFYLGHGEDGLRRGGCGLQRLHGLGKNRQWRRRCETGSFHTVHVWVNFKYM